MAVFFSRERRLWDAEWRSDLENRQHELRGLTSEEADEFLLNAAIEDNSIRQAMPDRG